MPTATKTCPRCDGVKYVKTNGAYYRCTACGGAGMIREPVPAARHSDPQTSHDAAASVTRSAASDRQRILDYLRRLDDRGSNAIPTADHIDEALGLRLTTAGRRLAELHKLGLAEPLPHHTGRTRTGRQARVWRAVQ